MKRDWDLLRTLLNDIEEERDILANIPDKSKWPNEIDKEKEEARQLEHLQLLVEGGLVEGIDVGRGMNGHFYYSIANPRLTMAGHDFLEVLRSPKLWEKIKSLAKETGIALSVSVIKCLSERGIQNFMGG